MVSRNIAITFPQRMKVNMSIPYLFIFTSSILINLNTFNSYFQIFFFRYLLLIIFFFWGILYSGYQEIKEDILRHELAQTSRRLDFRKAIRLLNEKDRADYERSQSNLPNFKSRQKRSVKSRADGNNTRQRRRPARNIYRRKKRNCARYEMYVDFSAIGWSGWIISPKGYNAYHCAGSCPFPLGQSHKPTNHATVQSIVHALHADKNVLTPCCVPDKLYSISLLYFDDDENVILKLYEDMVAASCGCH